VLHPAEGQVLRQASPPEAVPDRTVGPVELLV
jgi:hypothetical protein